MNVLEFKKMINEIPKEYDDLKIKMSGCDCLQDPAEITYPQDIVDNYLIIENIERA